MEKKKDQKWVRNYYRHRKGMALQLGVLNRLLQGSELEQVVEHPVLAAQEKYQIPKTRVEGIRHLLQ
jgi:hypothetical protein